MKARLRLTSIPGALPFTIVAPGTLHGRAHARAGHMMRFVAEALVSATVVEGNVWWVNDPVEQDFGRGVRFSLHPGVGEGELLG